MQKDRSPSEVVMNLMYRAASSTDVLLARLTLSLARLMYQVSHV